MKSLKVDQLLYSLPPPLTLQQAIGIDKCQLPIDIESVKDVHLERTSHSLMLVDE